MSGAIRKRLLVGVLAAVLGGAWGVAGAPGRVNAALPGAAGRIAWQKNDASGSHIWTMRGDGSDKTSILSGAYPAWSPDGKKLLYSDGAGLSTADPDGANATHISDVGIMPTWSPDGTKIAFASFDGSNYEIDVANADGSNATNVTNSPNEDIDPSWSPDGTKIAFRTNRNGIDEIYRIDADGSNPTNLSNGAAGSDPDWSPDGTKIAFASGGIWVMNADGSNKVHVTTEGWAPAWSPDGTKIVFSSHRDLNDEIYAMNANGTNLVRLTNDNAAGATYPEDWFPSWQPRAFATAPAAVAFGSAVLGTPTAAKAITFTAGANAVSVTAAAISGADAADFDITSDTCSGVAVAAFASCTVGVRFDPGTVGAKTASLDFTGPDPLGTTSVALSGTGRLFLWGAAHYAGPGYTWNFGDSLGATVSGATTYLHATYTTDRVSGAWVTDRGPRAGVYYIRSTNGGTTWTTPRRLNPLTQHGSRGSVAASGTYVYATWVSTTRWINYSGTAPRILYFRRNTFHGSATKWGATIRLTSLTGRVDFPVLAASGTYVYVAYTDSATGAIKVARSGNRGASWVTTTIGTTTKSSASGRNGFPEIAAYGSTVAVTWVATSTNEARVRISSTHGATWGTVAVLGTTGDIPDVAAVGNRVGVTWTSGGVNVRVATGGVWGAPVALPLRDGYDSEDQVAPAISLLGTTYVGIAYTSSGTPAVAASIALGRSAIRVTPRDTTPIPTSLVWRESIDNAATWAPSDVVASPTHTRWNNDSPSIYWRFLKKPFLLWNGWTPNSLSYRLYIRSGA